MSYNSLRDELFRLFSVQSTTLISYMLLNENPEDELIISVDDYIDRHQKILTNAKHFILDEDAERLLYKLLHEMNEDGLEDTFQSLKFPFPYIILECGRDLGAKTANLFVEGENGFYSESFIGTPAGVTPNSKVLVWEGTSAEVFSSPLDISERINTKDQIDQELLLNSQYSAMFVAMITLLNYKGMLSTSDESMHLRADRRRAKKLGTSLPDIRKITVKLGALGRVQLNAMSSEKNDNDNYYKRAHWVRGHFMRNRSGGLSWRNPHIRGAGPLIDQQRIIKST